MRCSYFRTATLTGLKRKVVVTILEATINLLFIGILPLCAQMADRV